MSYNDTPLAQQDQDVSQPLIRANFLQANTSFGTDHYAFTDLTVNNGYHKTVTTPDFGSAPNSTATYDVFYAQKQTNPLGILQYSRGWNTVPSVPSPVTHLQSPATPIMLAPAATTNVLDFTGITNAICNLYAVAEDTATVADQLQAFVTFDGTLLNITSLGTNLKAISSGTILQIQNNGAGAKNKVYWTLVMYRLQ